MTTSSLRASTYPLLAVHQARWASSWAAINSSIVCLISSFLVAKTSMSASSCVASILRSTFDLVSVASSRGPSRQ